MLKTIYGSCPALGKDHSISVQYIDDSTLSETCYVKGTFECSLASYENICPVKECPLYKSAPSELH